MRIKSIQLTRIGGEIDAEAVVDIEFLDGRFFRIIRECVDGNFSHNVNVMWGEFDGPGRWEQIEFPGALAKLEGDFESLKRSRSIIWCSKGHEILMSSPIPGYPILLFVKCPECGEPVRTIEAMKQNEQKLKAENAKLRAALAKLGTGGGE